MARKSRRAERDVKGDANPDIRPTKRLATWQIVTLVVAGVVSLAGGAMWIYSAASAKPDTQLATMERRSNPDDLGAGGFAPMEPSDDTQAPVDAPEAQTKDTISPAIFRLGFSFVVGFAIAYALRTFIRISLIAIGVMALALFGLQYAGVIDVDWAAMGNRFDGVRDYLAAQTASFQTFITGQLPSAASALAGLAIGFKKK